MISLSLKAEKNFHKKRILISDWKFHEKLRPYEMDRH